jgi:peptide chain release factor 2
MINPKELIIEQTHKPRLGGQQVGKIDAGVKITHIPTNLSVSCDYHRSQIVNRNVCLEMIELGILELIL